MTKQSTSILLKNQTDSQKTYNDGQIVLPASDQVEVLLGQIAYIARDFSLQNDLRTGDVQIDDGFQVYENNRAIDFLTQYWVTAAPPQSSNDPIVFCLAGRGFSLTADGLLTSSDETPVLLVNNPSDSGINARGMIFYGATESRVGVIVARTYTNPTVSSNGIPLTPSNCLVSDSSPSSAITAYGAPTVSDKGVKRIALVDMGGSNTALLNFAQTVILTPGNSLLVTASVSGLADNTSALTHFYFQWVEV